MASFCCFHLLICLSSLVHLHFIIAFWHKNVWINLLEALKLLMLQFKNGILSKLGPKSVLLSTQKLTFFTNKLQFVVRTNWTNKWSNTITSSVPPKWFDAVFLLKQLLPFLLMSLFYRNVCVWYNPLPWIERVHKRTHARTNSHPKWKKKCTKIKTEAKKAKISSEKRARCCGFSAVYFETLCKLYITQQT